MLYDYVVMHFEFKQESNYKNHVFKEGIINVNNINFIMYVCACSMIVYLPFLREIAKDLGQSVNNCNTIVIAFRVIRTVLPYYRNLVPHHSSSMHTNTAMYAYHA